MERPRLTGLVAAVHTPFAHDGSLRAAMAERQAEHLARHGVAAAFVGGTTGECHSLTLAERMALSAGWLEAAPKFGLDVVVHVGGNCLADAATLAAQADTLGARAIAAVAPSYFKPADVGSLVACMQTIVDAAPRTPFYYYDIPELTGVRIPAAEFLRAAAGRLPGLNGVKFTNPDLAGLQECLALDDGRFDILWGCDESLLAALALGVRGAVGSTYNFAAPVYHRIARAFETGDLESARLDQHRSVQLVRTLAHRGYLGASKALMASLGVDVGGTRPPLANPTPDQLSAMQADLESIGYFTWGAA